MDQEIYLFIYIYSICIYIYITTPEKALKFEPKKQPGQPRSNTTVRRIHPMELGDSCGFLVFFFEKALIEILVIVDINVNMQATLTLIDGDCDNLNFYLYDLIYGIICTCVSSISD